MGKLSFPGNFGFQVIISHGNFGCERVVCECVVTHDQLLAIQLNFTLISRSSLVDLESSEFLKVRLHLQGLSWGVFNRDFCLSHTMLHMFQESRSKEFKFIRLLISCHQKLQCFVTIFHDFSLGMELVQNNILVLLVNKELKLTSPRVEGCQELVLADEILVQDRFGIDFQSIMKNKLELILIVDLLSRPGNFEHLHSSLFCQHTDISSVLSIVSTSSFQVQTSKDIGINNQALANLVKKFGAASERIYGLTVVSAVKSTALLPSFSRWTSTLNLGASLFLCFLSTKICILLPLVWNAPYGYFSLRNLKTLDFSLRVIAVSRVNSNTSFVFFVVRLVVYVHMDSSFFFPSITRLSPRATLTINSMESFVSPSVFFKVKTLFSSLRSSFPAIFPPNTAYLVLASKEWA